MNAIQFISHRSHAITFVPLDSSVCKKAVIPNNQYMQSNNHCIEYTLNHNINYHQKIYIHVALNALIICETLKSFNRLIANLETNINDF